MANGYALGQLSSALLTAATGESRAVRRRADRRAAQWAKALAAMEQGTVEVGSRTPVHGLPAWVTLEVLRGGYATGDALAGGPLGADEIALARELGLPADRQYLFGYFLTDAGLERLVGLVDSGAYRIEIPEDAALLTVAWLVRAGDRAGAFDVLEAIAPFADTFRFAPKPSTDPINSTDAVHRVSVHGVAQKLRARVPDDRVERQREALSVWNPFFDRLLSLWLQRWGDGDIATEATAAWRAEADALVAEYRRLALAHTLCSKHRKPQENFSILLSAMEAEASGHELDGRRRGLLRTTIASAVAKRGAPGTSRHESLRRSQGTVATTPGYARFAQLAADRLGPLDQHQGIADVERLSREVQPDEEVATGIARGQDLPVPVRRVLRLGTSAPIEVLLEDGLVPSAEVLAELLPQITATVLAGGYADPGLGRLAGRTYAAFRRRRSLLLSKLEKQVQHSELPWAAATFPHRGETTDEAMGTARRAGGLTLDYFPATILPNPLVQELQQLLSTAGHDLALVEELAADIFMGRFSEKFRRAAQSAMEVINGTLYAAYYDVPVARVRALRPQHQKQPEHHRRLLPPWTRRTSTAEEPPQETFADLCWERAGHHNQQPGSVATNGTVIEQSQILTTHNLAALVTIGTRPTRPWADLARDCLTRTSELLTLAVAQDRPLTTVKDAAYAWRHGIFFLSMAGPAEAATVIAETTRRPQGPEVMGTLLADLSAAANGTGAGARTRPPFLGWTTGEHWVLTALRDEGGRSATD